jgi:hypothetical protein
MEGLSIVWSMKLVVGKQGRKLTREKCSRMVWQDLESIGHLSEMYSL